MKSNFQTICFLLLFLLGVFNEWRHKMTGEIRERMAVIREQLTRETSIVAFITSNWMTKHDMRSFILILNDLFFFLIHCCIVCLVVKDWEMFRSGRNFIPKWECQLDTPRTERIFQNGPKSSRFNLTGKLCNILCISSFYMWCALYR